MNVHRLIRISAAILFAVLTGCNGSPPEGQARATPEETYRSFMLANLTEDESAIRPLVLDHPEADLLWPGAGYPPDVAALLSEQYQIMEISRFGTPSDDRVLLQSSAVPMPLEMVKVNGQWRLDARPIIEFRKAAAKLQREKAP